MLTYELWFKNYNTLNSRAHNKLIIAEVLSSDYGQ